MGLCFARFPTWFRCLSALVCVPLQVVFTIHNMNYGQKKISEAAYYCQKFTTVSATYAFEVGGHPAIAGEIAALHSQPASETHALVAGALQLMFRLSHVQCRS